MKELPPDIHEKVQALRASGDALQETGEFVDAVVKYEQAFALLPERRQSGMAIRTAYCSQKETIDAPVDICGRFDGSCSVH